MKKLGERKENALVDGLIKAEPFEFQFSKGTGRGGGKGG